MAKDATVKIGVEADTRRGSARATPPRHAVTLCLGTSLPRRSVV